MTKRILSLALALILCFTLLHTSALAYVKNPPEKNATLGEITVKVPFCPDLEITMTKVPYLAGEIDIGSSSKQLKFFCGENTTVSFNKDMKIASLVGKPTTIKAGKSFKPMSLESGYAVGVTIIEENGKYRFTNSLNISTTGKIYDLSFVSVVYYAKNTKEGYKFTDIRDWTVETESKEKESGTAAGNTKSYSIKADYNADKKSDYSYTITEVQKVEKLKFAANPGFKGSNPLKGKTVNVYTVAAGSKIKIDGANGFTVNFLQYKNKELSYNTQADKWTSDDWQKAVTDAVEFENHMLNSSGAAYGIAKKGSYVSLDKEGYYIFAARAFNSKVMDTDPKSKTFGQVNYDNVYKYNAIVVHVVK